MFEIRRREQLTSNIYLMEISAYWVARAAKPGQFIIIIIDDKGERIPLTICDYNKEEGSITIVFQIVGKSTEKLAKLGKGNKLKDVVGPLGKESLLMYVPEQERANKRILFIGGGVGTAPIYPQVKWVKEHGMKADVIIGTKTHNTLILEDMMKEVADNLYVCTDDGSYGMKGLVTDCLKSLVEKGEKYDEVVAIGPMVMMKFVSLLTKELGIKTTVSLNSLMVDGTGMCGACRVTIGGKTKFTCVDGPEFDAHLVDFDEAIRRQSMYKTHEIATDSEDHKCNLTAAVNHTIKKRRVPVREQDAIVRVKNFDEVCYGYTMEEAMEEADRCLQCKNPGCVSACPVSIDIPAFIKQIRGGHVGHFAQAYKIISSASSLPAVCGRVCPQESQCEGSCVLGKKGDPVAIGKLERFVADWAREVKLDFTEVPPTNGKKVAIVGSGPSGLTCAGDLAKMGYEVTIFEALHQAGGVLVYGIPEFRLPKEKVVKEEVENIKKLGVKIVTDVIIGRSITIDELFDKEGFSAVYIASGAGLPKFMNIPGKNLNGVVSANELLTRSNLMKAYEQGYDTPVYPGKVTIVVGGGNVAMDAARTARRLGAEVHVVYRRGKNEMPARAEEVHHAKEEGIEFHYMTNPVEILGDEHGWVKSVKCIKMELGEPDASGRRSPVELPGSEHEIPADCVIMALGTAPNKLIIDTTDNLSATDWGGIQTDEHAATSREGIFAGGDAVMGAATVILAMGAGKKAAKSIDEYLRNK